MVGMWMARMGRVVVVGVMVPLMVVMTWRRREGVIMGVLDLHRRIVRRWIARSLWRIQMRSWMACMT